jgi:hypothetical protein
MERLNLKKLNEVEDKDQSCVEFSNRVAALEDLDTEWRKLHNEELRDLYSSPSIIRIIKLRRMRWASHVTRMGEKRNAYRLLGRKPEGKRPLGRPRHRWMDNIRMDLGELGWDDVDWIGLAQDRNGWRALVNSVLNIQCLSKRINSFFICRQFDHAPRAM